MKKISPLVCGLALLCMIAPLPAAPAPNLGEKLQPFVDCLNGVNSAFAIDGQGTVSAGGKPQAFSFAISRDGDQTL